MTDGKSAFARRLNEAFDRLDIPAKQHGRFTALARLFGVSPVAARDWCEGNSYPSVDKLLVIMDTVRCGADWLLFGRMAPAPDPIAASVHGQTHADGASGSEDTPGLEWHTVKGDAMAPTLSDGDRIGWRALDGTGLRDGVHLLAGADPGSADTPLLRRCLRRLDGTIECSCDNPLHAERVALVEASPGLLSALTPGAPALRVLGRAWEVRKRLS